MVTIYLVTNLINNKVYVGQTRQIPKRRWSRHIFDAVQKGMDLRFYRAIRKYGSGAFDFQEIAIVETQEQANNLEKLWILCLRATEPDFGYNDTFGGEGGALTESAKAKQATANKKSWTPERRKAVSEKRKGTMLGPANPMYGKSSRVGTKHTEETKRKMSEARKAYFTNPEARANLSKQRKGKPISAEHRAKISAALIGNQYRKGIPHSDEIKQQIKKSVERAYDEGRHTRVGLKSHLTPA